MKYVKKLNKWVVPYPDDWNPKVELICLFKEYEETYQEFVKGIVEGDF